MNFSLIEYLQEPDRMNLKEIVKELPINHLEIISDNFYDVLAIIENEINSKKDYLKNEISRHQNEILNHQNAIDEIKKMIENGTCSKEKSTLNNTPEPKSIEGKGFRRRIAMVDAHGNIIKTYMSILAAAKDVNGDQSCIRKSAIANMTRITEGKPLNKSYGKHFMFF